MRDIANVDACDLSFCWSATCARSFGATTSLGLHTVPWAGTRQCTATLSLPRASSLVACLPGSGLPGQESLASGARVAVERRYAHARGPTWYAASSPIAPKTGGKLWEAPTGTGVVARRPPTKSTAPARFDSRSAGAASRSRPTPKPLPTVWDEAPCLSGDGLPGVPTLCHRLRWSVLI